MSPNRPSILDRLRERQPFEGSRYERSAEEVYLAGLNCVGETVYASLEDALDDWRLEYECDLAETAQDLADNFSYELQELWLSPPAGLPPAQLADKIRVAAMNTGCPKHAALLLDLADEVSARRAP